MMPRSESGHLIGPLPTTLREALDETSRRKRHLLLGNGFSIDARPTFSYASLYRQVSAGMPDALRSIFEEEETSDFEHVLNELRRRAEARHGDAVSIREFVQLASELKSAFAQALTECHPPSALCITDGEKRECAQFLSNFVGPARKGFPGKIFTTNYDLLLYWVLVKHGDRLRAYDGFISPAGEKTFGNWRPDDHEPELFYLHGALHLYMEEGCPKEIRYHHETRLVQQVTARLQRRYFPMIISEGDTGRKAAKICTNPYLSYARDRFAGALRGPRTTLFTLGHSFDDRDWHILEVIGGSRVGTICAGVFGGLASKDGERLQTWIARWVEMRRAHERLSPLKVYVFDSSKVSAWGRRSPVADEAA
jgi:hypothetical protein